MNIWIKGLEMSSRFRRFAFVIIGCVVAAVGSPSQSASALDTPNALMGVDGMVMLHYGLFRNDPAIALDGINTFQFGPIAFAAGTQGRYHSFYFVKNGEGDGGISHNARNNSNTPEHWNGTAFQTVAPLDVTSAYFPVVDRSAYGQRFDPELYQIEVKFKPNQGIAGLPNNTAPFFTVGLDQQFGYVFDADPTNFNGNTYKRAAEQIVYNIGSAENPVNDWYASAPKDADGFATFTVPLLEPSFVHKSFYHNFGDGDFRNQNVSTGGGRVMNEDGTWSDVTIGYGENFQQFGGGPTDPSRPGSKLDVPNGVPLISFGAPNAEAGLSVEIKSIGLTKINPGSIVARLDANSGITFRFGSGLTRGANASPIPIPNDPFGLGYLPLATDQISRFDQNGMTNLFINMRTPDNADEVHRFILRGAPGPNTFDGTNATVNIRARLLEPLTNAGIAQNLTIVAKDLDGNDNAANPVGADEYAYNLDLSQFNTSTFTTVSVPLSAFTLSPFVPTDGTTAGSGPFGFANPGDGSRSEFNLYEFGGLIPAGGGLLRMELEYLEIRLPEVGLAGDFDNDSDVDGQDFLVWQRGGSPNPLSSGDLADWRTNFGMASQLSAVPEPGSALLAVVGVALIARRRK
jgi:hypothetical protein